MQQKPSSDFQAIEYNSLEKLKESVESMEKHATDKTKYLDVCYLQSEMSLSRRRHTFYFMTLLSYAAVHGHKNMVKELIERGASKDFDLQCSIQIVNSLAPIPQFP